MPTLEWMGKNKVVAYHSQVPYRVLERVPEKSVMDSHGSDRGNMIIHGDNLEALKALLPEYEGKVDCIYIDPPYNTGNEGWVYNDNVNDPRIRKWLGEVVGKEGEDFSRHDKWLCMMYPRLQLLHKLLKPQGAIFVSLDSNEIDALHMMMNEIFGESNHVETITLLCNPKGRSQDKYFATCHEYLVVYSKGRRSAGSFSIEKDESLVKSDYNYVDDAGRYRTIELRNTHREFNRRNRPNLWYPIYLSPTGDNASLIQDDAHPNEVYPIWPDGDEGCWTWGTEKATRLIHLLMGKKQETGWKVYRKDYAKTDGEVARKKPFSIWQDPDFYTEKGQSEFAALFPGANKNDFPQPKSVALIEEIIRCSTGPHDLILDSFAGSGTTSQAVLNVNRDDGGDRRFISIEMCDYADSVTAERVRRVISGYERNRSVTATLYSKKLTAANLKSFDKYYAEALDARSKASAMGRYGKVTGPKISDSTLVVEGLNTKGTYVEGVDSGFSFYELGPVLFDSDGSLNADVPREEVFKYVWYSETKATYMDMTNEHPYLLGVLGQTVYYLAYEPDRVTTLGPQMLRMVPRRGAPTVVYADRCVFDDDKLNELNVVFKQIPRQIARI